MDSSIDNNDIDIISQIKIKLNEQEIEKRYRTNLKNYL